MARRHGHLHSFRVRANCERGDYGGWFCPCHGSPTTTSRAASANLSRRDKFTGDAVAGRLVKLPLLHRCDATLLEVAIRHPASASTAPLGLLRRDPPEHFFAGRRSFFFQ